MKTYVGHPLQTRGVEHYTLQYGKGDGMKFLYIRNGLGLEAWLSLDRAGDISKVTFKGDNFAFLSPCGYVSPQYYDCVDAGFLKSFNAGFFTTCGLFTVGTPCTQNGEELPLHGNISHIPAILNGIDETDEGITIKLTIRDTVIFGRKLVLKREYKFSYTENTFSVSDTVTNEGDKVSPYMILYHCNMGYPLLTENSIVKVPHNSITARSEEAQKYIDTALQMEKPQPNFEERCYFFDVKEKNNIAKVGIYSPEIEKGLIMSYDKRNVPYFTEWKMMGKTDYVLGLEPGNCQPGKRPDLEKEGIVKYLNPDESGTTEIKFSFVTDKNDFEGAF